MVNSVVYFLNGCIILRNISLMVRITFGCKLFLKVLVINEKFGQNQKRMVR